MADLNELVEVLARGIEAVDLGRGETSLESLLEWWAYSEGKAYLLFGRDQATVPRAEKALAEKIARAALGALEAANYRVVPIDPTREMFDAGRAYLHNAGGSRGLIGAWRDMCDIAHPPTEIKVDSPPLREGHAMGDVSTLDWSEMCDVALAVRKRIKPENDRYILTDRELTVLVCAALEYSNRLAHEAGARLKAQQQEKTMDEDEDLGTPLDKGTMLRHAALDYALRSGTTDPTDVLAAAEKYLAFLKGGDPK